jgi:uncharacterized membrane protein (DUF373 family)
MQKLPKNTPLPWYCWFSHDGVIVFLETVQDAIVISLCVDLFSFMAIQL